MQLVGELIGRLLAGSGLIAAVLAVGVAFNAGLLLVPLAVDVARRVSTGSAATSSQ